MTKAATEFRVGFETLLKVDIVRVAAVLFSMLEFERPGFLPRSVGELEVGEW